MYLREIGRVALLTAKDEVFLARAVELRKHLNAIRKELETELGREPGSADMARAFRPSEEMASSASILSFGTCLRRPDRMMACDTMSAWVTGVSSCFLEA